MNMKEENILKSKGADLDYHTYKASEHFGVPCEKVTREQRIFAKMFYGLESYAMEPSLLKEAVEKHYASITSLMFKVPEDKVIDSMVDQAKSAFLSKVLVTL